MIAKYLNKILALDGRSTSVEYGIIAVLLFSAFVSTALAINGVGGDFYSPAVEEISSANQKLADTSLD